MEDILKYMKQAIDVMKKSVQEPRSDKTSPKVGAILLKPDGTVETAYRGELRHGDHAEFTLIERKNRDKALDDSILFATLEPCAPGARKPPKLSCSERIVNARIKKVWIGIEDPDPMVDRKGIKYLIDNGVEVGMFPPELQQIIRDFNKQFIEEAEERAKEIVKEKDYTLTLKEKIELSANIEDLSQNAIELFIQKAELNTKIKSENFYRIFNQLGYLELKDNIYYPTGIGLLLFGKRPQLKYPNALIRATFKTKGRNEEIATFEGPIIDLTKQTMNWYKEKIGHQLQRDTAERYEVPDFPAEVIRETISNAVAHRDYDIEGAPIYMEISDNVIIIKSPGKPVEPIKLKDIQLLRAPSLSRNPKIMYAFDQLKLVEQRGLGFNTIKELPTKYNLPLPVILFEEPYLIFKFPRSFDIVKQITNIPAIKELNNDELRGYEWIKIKGEVSKKEYAKHFNFNDKKAQRHLVKMMKLGLLGDNNTPKTSPHYKYVIKSDA
jgi:ATP-dependent DNA helicase RecG